MKKISYLILLCITFSLVSCENKKKGDLQEGTGSIYGCVTDFATGNPIHNANVQLRPTGETTLTGSDGMYEFLDLKDGDYSITASKAEYGELIDDYVIQVKNGLRMRRDVQIEKIPTYIRFTDVYGNDIKVLDFGSSLDMQAFNIYNNGTVSINCEIEHNCKWITSVSEVPSSIKPGQSILVSIRINRNKLNAGDNIDYLYIRSNNGSNVIQLKAIGGENLPDVTTLSATDPNGNITAWCNTFHAEVTKEGNPAYHQRGFCYSSTNSTPTINDNRINVSGTGLGHYEYTCWDLPARTTTYYVRAWVMYDSDNKVIYGNVKSFTYNDVN